MIPAVDVVAAVVFHFDDVVTSLLLSLILDGQLGQHFCGVTLSDLTIAKNEVNSTNLCCYLMIQSFQMNF